MKNVIVFWGLLCLVGCAKQQEFFDQMKVSMKTEDLPSQIAELEEEKVKKTVQQVQKKKQQEKQRDIEKEVQKEPKKIIPPKPTKLVLKPKDEWPEVINKDTIVKKGAHLLISTVTIEAGVEVTIEPGTKIELQQCGIKCSGTIRMQGTKSSPIVVYGPDGWDNIFISGEKAAGYLRHCKISGGVGVEAIQDGDAYSFSEDGGEVVVAGRDSLPRQSKRKG